MPEAWARISKGKVFTAVKDGEVYPTDFGEGEIVDGGLVAIAVKAKKAERGKGERPADPAPENKDLGPSPENAAGSALGERVRYLQDENTRLEGLVGQQKNILTILGVDAEFIKKLSSEGVSEEEIDEFADKVKAARAAKTNNETPSTTE